MSIRIVNENRMGREPGYKIIDKDPSYVIYQGTVLVKVKNGTTGDIEVRPYVNSDDGTLTPAGIALDQNQQPPIAPTGNEEPTVGEGYDYTNFNRGGLVAPGDDMIVWIWANSLVLTTDTWLVGTTVYWDGDNERYTDTSAGSTEAVGVLEDKVTVSGAVTQIKVKIKSFS